MIDIAKAHGGGGMSEPVAWTLAREGGELVYAVSSREAAEAWAANTNYHAAPIYTTDAIREAVEAAHARMIADGWRQCAKGQRTTQFCGQLQKAVEAEREACAKVCEAMDHDEPRTGAACAAAILARGAA